MKDELLSSGGELLLMGDELLSSKGEWLSIEMKNILDFHLRRVN